MKKGSLYRLIAFLFIFFIVPINAKAAVTFGITKSADNIKPGGTTVVTINATGVTDEDSVAKYNLTITYDASKIAFISNAGSGSTAVNANGNTISLVGSGSPTFTSNFTVAKLNFKVLENATSGNAALTLSGSCDLNDEGAGGDCKTNSSQITVAALGTDASLKSLKIPNTTLKPGFSSDVTSYTATIQDITELTVNAVAADPNAKIAITDNYRSLQKGENKIDIVVTSENGQNRRTYSVVVTLNLTPTEAELLKASAKLKTLIIKGQKIDFDPSEKKYYLTVPYTVKKLNITATPENPKASVEVTGDKKLIVGKNTVKITVVSEDKTKIENYQMIVTREDQEKEIVQTCPDEVSTKEWIIFSVAMLITFTLGIILGYFLCKKDIFNKIFTKKENKEEAVEIETLSDTIDLSDTVKEVKKKNKGKNRK